MPETMKPYDVRVADRQTGKESVRRYFADDADGAMHQAVCENWIVGGADSVDLDPTPEPTMRAISGGATPRAPRTDSRDPALLELQALRNLVEHHPFINHPYKTIAWGMVVGFIFFELCMLPLALIVWAIVANR